MPDNIDNRPVMVSIKCPVYNHEKYLRDCLDGFVMQKTNFRFEAIVHDDASTDGSAAIIREYAEKYPDIIKPIYQKENQYSKRNGGLRRAMAPFLTGKYIAICEGDDYWTDPNKLQRQVDFLEKNPNVSLIAERGQFLFTSNNKLKKFGYFFKKKIKINDLIIRRQFATASVMYPNKYTNDFNTFIGNHSSYDTMTWLFLAIKGDVIYLPNISSIYRRGTGVTCINPDKFTLTALKWNDEVNELFGKTNYVNKKYIRFQRYQLLKKLSNTNYRNIWEDEKKEFSLKEKIYFFLYKNYDKMKYYILWH